MRNGACAAAAALAVFSATPAQAEIRALVVGVNEYVHERNLCGAVNDARDIADALNAAGAAEVVTVLDGAATRTRLISEFERLIDSSAPGDAVVFSFAGHGAQYLDDDGDEARYDQTDLLDEYLVLPGFSEDAADAYTNHALFDDDLDALFARRDDVRVIFIADTCHSGRMDRNASGVPGDACQRSRYLYEDENGRVRSAGYALPEDETPADARVISAPPRPNVIMASAVPENRRAPEIIHQGRPRGALSVAVAEAVRGRADFNEDGEISIAEFRDYVRARVEQVSNARQGPDVRFDRDPGDMLFAAASADGGAADDLPLTIRIDGVGEAEAERLAGQLPNVELVEVGAPAELIWDRETDRVVNGTHDVAAYRVGDEASFAAVVAGHRAVMRLTEEVPGREVAISIALFDQNVDQVFCAWRPPDQRDRVTFGFESVGWPSLLLNLTGLGGVQAVQLYPAVAPGETVQATVSIYEPFGQDNAIVLMAPDAGALEALHDDLCTVSEYPHFCSDVETSNTPRLAPAGVERILAFIEEHPDIRIGRRGLFTAPPGEAGCPAETDE